MSRFYNYRTVFLLGIASVVCCLYAYFAPTAIGGTIAAGWPLFAELPGDLPEYSVRFAASAVFLGILPLISLFILRGIIGWNTQAIKPKSESMNERQDPNRGHPGQATEPAHSTSERAGERTDEVRHASGARVIKPAGLSIAGRARSRTDVAGSKLPATLLQEIGLGRPIGSPFRWWPFWAILVFCILSGAVGAFDPGLSSFYPYSKTLVLGAGISEQLSGFDPAASGNIAEFGLSGGGVFGEIAGTWIGFLLHAVFYVLFYYLPWELFFRGFLILPLLSHCFKESESNPLPSVSSSSSSITGTSQTVPMFIACIQVVPSSLMHFGHPLSESLGAVVFGIFAGYLVLRFRSIWPPLMLHAVTGLSLDLAIRIGEII